MEKLRDKDTFLNGLIKSNPVFVLVLGMCPTLAMTSNLIQGFAMGIATTFVLIFSNTIISLLRKIIPDKIRIPCYIIIISTFVIIVELVMRKYLPDLYSEMKAFISLIVVNCVILARAESFASCNKVKDSALDGFSMGIGFTLALSVLGFIRELITGGTVLGFPIINNYPEIQSTSAKALGFIVLGLCMAAFNQIRLKKNKKNEGIK
jgi:electron transport complex protein RnfE